MKLTTTLRIPGLPSFVRCLFAFLLLAGCNPSSDTVSPDPSLPLAQARVGLNSENHFKECRKATPYDEVPSEVLQQVKKGYKLYICAKPGGGKAYQACKEVYGQPQDCYKITTSY